MNSSGRYRIQTGLNYRAPARWAKAPITRLFANSISEGRLGLQFEDEVVEVGSGDYVATIAPPSFFRFLALLLRPDYRIPSYYTRGFWCCERRKLYEFLELLITQKRSFLHSWFRMFERYPIRDNFTYRLFPLKVKQHIAAHYNTSPEFMRLILGDRLEYTCAFFDKDHSTLGDAQNNKIDTVIRRLQISMHHHVLDMGCGWGQIVEAVHEKTGARVTGINISDKQITFAQNSRTSSAVDFIQIDYEAFSPSNSFDRIYSIGMLEHVGRGKADNYFNKISELLHIDGRALVHCIVRRRPGSTNSWIDDQVFPGAYISELSDIVESIDRSGLRIDQIFTHESSNYFRTLGEWVNNFYKHEVRLRKILSSSASEADVEQIMRIWEFYLQGSRLVFNKNNGYCYNVQITLRH